MSRRAFLPTGPVTIVVAALLAGCGETGPSVALPPAAITNVTGAPLAGPAGEALSELVSVRVTDAGSSPLPGVSVTFAVTATGASVDPASAVTDDRGEARTRWTLGRTTGQQVLTVTAGGSTILQINATAGPARIGSIAVNAGNSQTGSAGTALGTNPSVVVKDASGNPVDGASVFFGVLTGGGHVGQPSATTNAQGIASPGAWTLGGLVGEQLLSAQVAQAGVSNNPLVFSATAHAGAPATVAAVSSTPQTALIGALVASPPSVVVRDAFGNPTPGVNVTFSITAGGGQLTGASQTTSAQGIATVSSWRVGPSPGTNIVSASVTGATPALFTATATAGAPAQLQISAGNNQTAPVNRPVPTAPQVRVVDAGGNGVAGVTVTFTVGSGGGAAIVSQQVTAGDGRAAVGAWILGPTPGANTLIASATGLTSVTFDATATGGAAVSMLPLSLVTQSGIAGQAAGSKPSVVVRDAQGNPVAGVAVTFAVATGGGSISGGTQTTDVNGTATVASWTFGAIPGENTVVASSSGLPSVTFTASTTGLPSQIVVFAGNNQAAVQGTAVVTKPAVRITDVNGLGAAGVTVTFAVTGGGGSLTGGTQVTDATGIATVGSWTLGSAAPNTMTATASIALTGNPVTFTASAATHVVVTQQPPASVASGTNFTVTVQLRDAANALSAVAGLPLTISIASGGGTLNAGSTALTVNTVAGVATFNVNITGASGSRTLSISGTGVGNVVTTAVNIP